MYSYVCTCIMVYITEMGCITCREARVFLNDDRLVISDRILSACVIQLQYTQGILCSNILMTLYITSVEVWFRVTISDFNGKAHLK